MEEKYKFIAYARNDFREVFPKNGNNLSINWEKKDDRALFSSALTGTIVFTGDDYRFLKLYEDSQYRCDFIDLLIKRRCNNGEYQDFKLAKLALNKGKWNDDMCRVEIEATVSDKYSCYDLRSDDEINILSQVSPKETINLVSGTIEKITCSGSQNDATFCLPAEMQKYYTLVYAYTQQSDLNNQPDPNSPEQFPYTYFQYDWITERKVSSTPLPYPWENIGGNNWLKKPNRRNAKFESTSSGSVSSQTTTWEYGGSFRNGMSLMKVMEAFLRLSCPNLTLRSDFFQWNPVNVSNINYVTGKESDVRRLILFQKTDIKRPTASASATIANTTFSEILSDLCNMFQLQWDIDEETDQFVIEHVSYFDNAGTSIDLVGRYDKALRAGLQSNYDYDVDNMPNREVFTMLDSKYTYGDFAGKPILYNNSCAGVGDKSEETYQVENITTDIENVMNNPSSESQVISEDGFVLVATYDDGSIIQVDGILETSKMNNVLSWAWLQNNYWKHNRPFNRMVMNDIEQRPITVKPTKKLVPLNVQLCCNDEEFDPNQFVNTELGLGKVATANFDLYRELLVVELLYNPFEGILENVPPVAVHDEAETFMNSSVLVDVLANDYDTDNEIDRDSIVITSVTNGTAVVEDQKVRFTPANNFVGTTYFFYTIKDMLAETSNIARVTIAVRAGSAVPIARPDNYRIAKNRTLRGGNVLVNDTGDGQLRVRVANKTTAYGGTISFDNVGNFVYEPPLNFVGSDTVNYTMYDSNNNEAEGLVTIQVFDAGTVYISMGQSDYNYEYTCDQPPTQEQTRPEGIYEVMKLLFGFYSDAAGTIPLDVKDFDLIINVRVTQTTNGGNPSNYLASFFPKEGTTYKSGEQIISTSSCDLISQTSRSYALEPSPNYVILQ